jgi:hypothetical protein
MADQQPEALREAHELLGKVYALMQRGEVGLTHGARGGIWVLPDRIGAWLEAQDAALTAGVGGPAK